MGIRGGGKGNRGEAENLTSGAGQGDEKMGLRRLKGNSLKGQSKGKERIFFVKGERLEHLLVKEMEKAGFSLSDSVDPARRKR